MPDDIRQRRIADKYGLKVRFGYFQAPLNMDELKMRSVIDAAEREWTEVQQSIDVVTSLAKSSAGASFVSPKPRTFCEYCDKGLTLHCDDNGYYHMVGPDDPPCANYDDELVHYLEPLGKMVFRIMRRTRNGKLRWFRVLEQHADGTYTYPGTYK